MEYIYAALLLHRTEKEITEENLRKVIEATGTEVDESKVKTLIASLKGVDIAKELENAAIVPVSAGTPAEAKVEKKEEPKAEEAAEGLSALFG